MRTLLDGTLDALADVPLNAVWFAGHDRLDVALQHADARLCCSVHRVTQTRGRGGSGSLTKGRLEQFKHLCERVGAVFASLGVRGGGGRD